MCLGKEQAGYCLKGRLQSEKSIEGTKMRGEPGNAVLKLEVKKMMMRYQVGPKS